MRLHDREREDDQLLLHLSDREENEYKFLRHTINVQPDEINLTNVREVQLF